MAKQYKITSEQMFEFQKPKWNGHLIKTGPHKNKKIYDRKRSKKELRDTFIQERI